MIYFRETSITYFSGSNAYLQEVNHLHRHFIYETHNILWSLFAISLSGFLDIQ